MKFHKYLLLIAALLNITFTSYSQNNWAIAVYPTPVLNSPDFESVFGGIDGKTVRTNSNGNIDEMEFIAFEGTVFEILNTTDKVDHQIYEVNTDEYNYNKQLFIDSRFVKTQSTKPEPRKINLPSKAKIYEFLDKATGSRYCWGGNYYKGIDKLLEFYKPSTDIPDATKDEWMLKGVDCSGLMYEATNGYTERNTSKLINFGEPVQIEGMSSNEIANILKPLDMIVWDGHVIYVYDKNTSIQSINQGVIKSDLLTTIQNVMNSRKPVNNYVNTKGKRFAVRRWYPE